MIIDPCPIYVPHWWQWYPPVGTFIGILAGLGVLVPWLFRTPDQMKRTEKAVWTLVMFALVLLEIRSLYLDRDQHDREQAQARCEQIERFGQIAAGIRQSVAQSEKQYESTIGQVQGVLSTTQSVAKLAKENLESVTGARSFPYVVPFTGIPPAKFDVSRHFVLMIVNEGPDFLSGISVSLMRVMAQTPHGETGAYSTPNPILVGSLGPRTSETVPQLAIWKSDLQTTPNSNHYVAYISAQNGSFHEDIYLRPAKAGGGWAYRIQASKDGNGNSHIFKTIDWREPQHMPE
ncbi:MAG TPA: hypothetical protein VGR47_01870 [Terracidiphilus sp.]|nr:hypothetical protein [Terracidiphilus sp.]